MFVVPGIVALHPQSGPHFRLPAISINIDTFDTAVQELAASLFQAAAQWPGEELQYAKQQCRERAEELLDHIVERAQEDRRGRHEALEEGEAPIWGRELVNLAPGFKTLSKPRLTSVVN